jgi:acyl-coenzyme A synthetase/AMP-(fatty) acid ligase
VVAEDGVDPDELMEYVGERVAPYKRLREIELVDEIPKSPSGKILRRFLRERYGQRP